MRVTNSIMIRNVLYDLNANMGRVNKLNGQLASNRRIVRLSDDSIGVLNSFNARQRLNRYQQYNENLVMAKNWINQAESATREIHATLTNIYERMVEGATDAKTPEDRKNMAAEVRQLMEHIVMVGNTVTGSQYIFGGYNTTEPPFKMDDNGNVLYNGINLIDTNPPNDAKIDAEQAQNYNLEVGFSMRMQVTFNGVDLMGTGDQNLFKVLGNVLNNLENGGSVADLSAQIEDVNAAIDRVMKNIVKAGAMQSKIKTLESRYADDIINYTSIKSDIEDIDQAEVIMQYSIAEATYKQALAVGARIIQPTLMDFLR